MPYKSEHAARIIDPNKFIKFRRENDKFGKGVSAIFGIEGEHAILQTIRFAVEVFSEDSAKEWLKKHGYNFIKFEPAAEVEGSLCSPYLCTPSEEVKAGRGGVGIRKFRKELVRTGVYYKANTGKTFSINEALLDHWVMSFNTFMLTGLEVPVIPSHSEVDKGLGYLTSVERVGGSLYGILELSGAEAEDLVRNNNVSIYSPAEYVDGFGNFYSRPLVHVALTPFPLIPGLGKFESLAASLLVNMEPIMDEKKLRELFGISEEVKSEELAVTIEASLTDMRTKLAAKEEEVNVLKKANDDQTLELSQIKQKQKPDSALLELAAENLELSLTGLVNNGNILPIVKTKLLDALVGKDNETLCLSIQNGTLPVVKSIVAALSENTAFNKEELSGAQDLELSARGKVEKSAVVKDAEERANAQK